MAGATSITDLLRPLSSANETAFSIDQANPLVNNFEISLENANKGYTRNSSDSNEGTSSKAKLEIQPKSVREHKLTSKLLRTQQTQLKTLSDKSKMKSIERIYELYLEALYFDDLLDLNSSRLKIAKDMYVVTKKLASKGKIDITMMLKAQSELDKYKYNSISLKNQNIIVIAELESLSKLKLSPSSFLHKPDFISTKALRANIDRVSSTNKNLEFKLLQADLESKTLEYDLEKEHSSTILKSLDLGVAHSYNKSRGSAQEISVGVTFKLPFSGGSSINNNNKLIKKLQSELKLKEAKEVAFTSLSSLKTSLIEKISLWNDMLSSRYIKQSKRQLSFLKKTRGSSPVQILTLKQIIVDFNINKTILEKEIYSSYIKLLSFTGIIEKYKNQDLLKITI
jgi:hypothetical protein